jgi:hypothetical protein
MCASEINYGRWRCAREMHNREKEPCEPTAGWVSTACVEWEALRMLSCPRAAEIGTSGHVGRASNVAADIYIATSQILVAERQTMPAQIIKPLIVN